MPLLLVAFIVAFLITKTIQDAKTDRALADKGIVSPRLQAKYGAGAAEKTARYGLVDYLRDAWSDNWQRRTELRRAATDAARDAKPAPGRSRVSWRDRLRAAQRAVVAAAERAAPLVRKLVDPVPVRRDPGPAVEAPNPQPDEPAAPPTTDDARRCPDCGAALTSVGTGWDHPGGPACPVTGRPYVPGPGPDQGRAAPATQTPTKQATPNPRRKPMSAPTGEAVNYETTVAELEAIAAKQREQIDAAQACLKSIEDAKSHIDGMQDAARSAAEASASINDHLAGLNLDGETLGHVGTAADALPASTVDTLLAQLEEVEATARAYLSAAETALAATEAALATVQAKYADAHATVQGELSGDARFLDSGAGTQSTAAA